MPDSKERKTMDEKYDELLRAFRSLNTKVNNNEKTNSERFTEIEKSIELLEGKQSNSQNNEGVDELQKRKEKIDHGLKCLEVKIIETTEKVDYQTKKLKNFNKITLRE